jgi:flagellar operon protein (TIGR03826 family)
MADVRNCKRCRKIFQYTGGQPICPDCKTLDEQTFKKVKDYIYSNPGVTLSEVSTVLDISVERIKGYLRDGRLEIVGGESNMFLECEKCGKSIKTGRFCDSCTNGITSDLRNEAQKLSSSDSTTSKSNSIKYHTKDEFAKFKQQ